MLGSANQAVDAAKARVDAAVNRFRDASRTAASSIDHANKDDLKNDSGFWHAIGKGLDWASEHLHLEALAGASPRSPWWSASSLPCSPSYRSCSRAAALQVVSLVAAGLTLVIDLVLQANKAFQGTFTWKAFALTMGMDALGVVVGGAGLRAGRAAAAARAATADESVATQVAARGHRAGDAPSPTGSSPLRPRPKARCAGWSPLSAAACSAPATWVRWPPAAWPGRSRR